MPQVTRHFLPWNRPVLELAGEWLMQQAGHGLLDLSSLLVVVPTRNAGRRLREILAQLAHERDRAILPPQVVPPEFLLSLVSECEAKDRETAGPEQTLLAWVRVLKSADLARYRALFPVDPVNQDFNWALGMAEGFVDLRRTLGEAGLEIADVVQILRDDLEEIDRWKELAKLEKEYKETLRRVKLADLQTVRRDQAGTPEIPDGIKRVVVIGTPDPAPLALQVLKALATELPMEVLVYAPESLAETFDAWGRPVVDYWTQHAIEIPDWKETVRVVPHALAQADLAVARIKGYESPADYAAIGVLDEEIFPALERRLETAGIAPFNPQGVPLRTQGVVHFLRALRDLMKSRAYRPFIELLRCPDYAMFLSSQSMFWDTSRVFEEFDQVYQKHLPQDLRDVRHFLRSGRYTATLEQITALNETERMLDNLEKHALADTLPDLLHQIFSVRIHPAQSAAERTLRPAFERTAEILEVLAGPLTRGLKLTVAEELDFVIRQLETEVLYEERAAGAVELLGWLELLWDDAPHLVVTGFNDGFVPEAIVGDIYLPEQLRSALAKKVDFHTNPRRFARDVYLLEALLNWRAEGAGRLELVLGKRSAQNDPRRPSRLLFRCRDEELAERAQSLFGDVSESEPNLAWTAGFQVQPLGLGVPDNPGKTIESLPVTAFRQYLTSPFHFYLQYVEEMRPLDGEKIEMDALDFGNFCHEILRRFGQTEGIRDSTNEAQIKEFLLAQADEHAAFLYGREPALPVQLQLSTARLRLAAAARVQALERQAGWKIIETENDLRHGGLIIDGVNIVGKVDRVDRHEPTGAVRVLDYKTSDDPDGPEKAHVTRVTASTNLDWLPEYACYGIGGANFRWKDLQLPLYRLGLRGTYGDQVICGYFKLPKALGETAVSVWEGLGAAHDAAAQDCAEGIIRDVRAGKFWPCVVNGRGDAYTRLHLNLPGMTVDPVNLNGTAYDKSSPNELPTTS